MNKERIEEIRKEAEKRISLWLKNTSWNYMTCNNSFVRFNMSIHLWGDSVTFEEDWMDKKDFKGFITEKEFDSIEYDELMTDLFYKYQRKQ